MGIAYIGYRVNEQGMVLEYSNKIERLIIVLKTCAKRIRGLRNPESQKRNHSLLEENHK